MNRLAPALVRWGGAARGLRGWRRRALAFAAGALATGALPPVHALPVLLVAFPVLVWLIDADRSPRSAFAVGWWFGFGHFGAGIYWIAFAFMVEAQRYGWLVPFAVIALAAVLGVFPGLAALAARTAPRGMPRVLVLAAAWTATEWLRAWVFTGFPWNLLGYAWAFSEAMIQLTALTGTYGLSLLTAAVAAAPALFADSGTRAGRRAVAGLGLAAGTLAAVWLGGTVRLATAGDAMVPGVRLRLVQGNIAQSHKWKAELRERHLLRYLGMSAGRAGTPPSHVIWPETAAPFFLDNDPRRRRAISRVVPEGGLVITGAPRTTPSPPPPGSDEPFRMWNSLYAIDREGRVRATYDKFHLVPFGEYVPFQRFLRFAKLTFGRGNFSAGSGPVTLDLPGLPPVSPLICYEIVFPRQVIAPGRRRPRWLLNLTNDAWFGTSSGPYQHLAAAQFRAVEEGLPVVRAANTGISAVVDAYGRIRVRLELNRAGTIDHGLPEALVAGTIYGLLGDWAPFGLVCLTVGMAVLVSGHMRRQSWGGGRCGGNREGAAFLL